MRVQKIVGILCAVVSLTLDCHATEYTLDSSDSVFAVVVHKAGVAARLAHNHLIYTSEYTATLSIDNTDATTARFALEFPVVKLQADAPEAHTKWYPGIEKAGILAEPFREIDEKDRATITQHMLDEGQLDAAKFPTISAKTVKVRAEASKRGKQEYTHIASIELTVHGKTVGRDCPASVSIDGDSATVDATGEFTFSEFGIKPYSALGGMVKSANPFHVFVHIMAKATP